MDNITENNKLIAEFLVKNEGGLVKLKENIFSTIDEFEIPDDYLTLKDLKYHKDWNWLMRVVEKIESFVFNENNSFNVTIGATNYCVIQDSNGEFYDGVEDSGETKLLTVYNACVKFIKWYNEQNKNSESL